MPDEAPPEDADRGEIIPREWHTEEDPSPMAPRLGLGLLVGFLGGAAASIPGTYLMFSTNCIESCSLQDDTRVIVGLAIAYAGLLGGTALGVTGAGSVFGGRGRFWPAVGGAALGSLVGLLTGLPLVAVAGGVGIVAMALGPVVGSLIAYELSHSSAVSAPQVVPLVSMSREGGVIGGLAGRF